MLTAEEGIFPAPSRTFLHGDVIGVWSLQFFFGRGTKVSINVCYGHGFRVAVYLSSGWNQALITLLRSSRLCPCGTGAAQCTVLPPLHLPGGCRSLCTLLNLPFFGGHFKLAQWLFVKQSSLYFSVNHHVWWYEHSCVVIWHYYLNFNICRAWVLEFIKCCLTAQNCIINYLKFTVVLSEVLASDLFFFLFQPHLPVDNRAVLWNSDIFNLTNLVPKVSDMFARRWINP